MAIRVVECSKCGDSDRFDSWPYDDEEDSDQVLERMIRAEEWTYTADLELCPSCSEVDQ